MRDSGLSEQFTGLCPKMKFGPIGLLVVCHEQAKWLVVSL
jgi:hypothetical protein